MHADSLPSRAQSARRQRVLIDALAARFGGTAYATVQLARRLADEPMVEQVIVLTRRGSIVARGLAGEPAVSCIALRRARRIELIRRVIWQAVRIRGLVARDECDVVITMSGMFPRSPGCKVMCLLFNPVMYENRTIANTLRRMAVRHTSRQAAFVAAPSQRLADLVTASIGRECAVARLGVDHDVFTSVDASGGELLCVADFYRHKRQDLVLDAWLCLPQPRPLLRFVGNPAADPKAHARLAARVARLPSPECVLLQNELTLDQLVDAYHRARVFILPSEHESFCMPLVESMACGVPPVVRGLPALREIGGLGARYVDGDDPAQWARELSPLITDDLEYERARAAALQRATSFSWDALADTMAAAF